jgi:hypothetical protein
MSWEAALIIVIVAVGAFCFYRYSRTENKVGNIAKEIMPLWASFAPFKDGHDSATTMYYCGWATHGKAFVEELEKRNAYKGHADSYDLKLGEWENLIKQSASTYIDGLEEKRRLVTALIDLDRRREEGKLPDWNSYNALGYIIKSPENASAKEFSSLLLHLMDTNDSVKNEALTLMEEYAVFTGNEIDQNLSAGFLCYVCLRFANENPELDISNEIQRLKDKTFEDHKNSDDRKP